MKRASIIEQRAKLVVQCACELLGMKSVPAVEVMRVDLSVAEFQLELQRRYGATHPQLVCRHDSSIERARLDREAWPELPRIHLRLGAPTRSRRAWSEVAQPAV